MKNLKKTFIAACLMAVAMPTMAGGESVDRKLDVDKDASIKIEVQNGVANIIGWDKAEMSVSGEIGERALGYVFKKTSSGAVFEIEWPENKRRNWGNFSKDDGAKLDIYVPMGSEVRFEGINTDVEVKKIHGESDIETVNGEIEASDLKGRVKLVTVNGEILAQDLEGKIRLETVNGDIDDKGSEAEEIYYATVNGDLRARTNAKEVNIGNVNGEIELKLEKINELKVETVNGDIKADFELMTSGEVDISTVSGDVDLYFRGDLSVDVEVDAHAGGSIKNKLTNDRVNKAKYGPSRSLRARVGSGSAEVDINTVSGDISLRRK